MTIKHLITVKTAKIEKGVSPKHVYELIKKEKLDGVRIDGVSFVINNEKYKQWEKKKKAS